MAGHHESREDARGVGESAGDAWLGRWREGRIGFHQDIVHPALERHWGRLPVAAGARVLVPLCGKSIDMRWLSQRGHRVLGVELSPLAIKAFVAEQEKGEGDEKEGVEHYQRAGLPCTRLGEIELLCGDFFHLDAEPGGELTAFYDRAALVALSSSTRKRYAHRLAELMAPGAPGLLITLSHDGGSGPPFSVDHAEVEALFARNFDVTLLETSRAEDGLPESVWQLVRKAPGY